MNKPPYVFGPEQSIREFDGRKLEGTVLKLELGHLNTYSADPDKPKEPTDQYVRIVQQQLPSPLFMPSGWIGRILGKDKEVIERTLRKAVLLEHRNGGRRDNNEYSSYAEFFNADRRKEVEAYRGGGLTLKLLRGGGDPDQADVKFYFDDIIIEDSCWSMCCPEEWYSEMHAKSPLFRFVDGFYENAEKAIEAFTQKKYDDMFGERYFPVCAFPHGTDQEIMENIRNQPKAASGVIVTDKWVIFGTRCKPYEFSSVIEETYKAGGKVPIGAEYSW
jgi:hypothetical protein